MSGPLKKQVLAEKGGPETLLTLSTVAITSMDDSRGLAEERGKERCSLKSEPRIAAANAAKDTDKCSGGIWLEAESFLGLGVWAHPFEFR